jgi:hypothetical protein
MDTKTEGQTIELTGAERNLLKWLGEEKFSQYGECHGAALDGLMSKGLAEVHEDQDLQAGFIARGTTLMYRAVSLTDAGRAAAEAQVPLWVEPPVQ